MKKRSLVTYITKLLAILVVAILALTLGILYCFFPLVSHYKPYWERLASNAIHKQVVIGSMEAYWQGLFPVVDLKNIQIYDSATTGNKLLEAQELQVSVNVLASLIHGQLRPAHLYLQGTHLIIKQLADDKVLVNGIVIPIPAQKPNTNKIEAIVQDLNELGRVDLNNIDIIWQGNNGLQIALTNIKLVLKSNLNQAYLAVKNINIKIESIFPQPLQFENVELHYLLGWPALMDLQGNVQFDNQRILIDVLNAHTLNIPIKNMHAEISSEKNPMFSLKWSSDVNLIDLTHFVMNSPLNKVLGKVLSHFIYQGPAHLNLALQLPLQNPKAVKVNGNITFKPLGMMSIPAYKIMLKKFQGLLEFTQTGVNAKKLTCELWGEKTYITVANKAKPNTNLTQVNVSGVLSFAALINTYHLDFLTKIITGKTPYAADLKFAKSHQVKNTQFALQSDFTGASINLPQPLQKAKSEKVPSDIKLDLLDEGMNIFFTYDKRFSTALELKKHNDHLNVERGDIEFGNGNAKLPVVPGILIAGKINYLDLTHLSQYLPDKPNLSATGPAGHQPVKAKPVKSSFFEKFNLQRVHLSFDQIVVPIMTLHKVFIQSHRTREYLVNSINSNELAGEIAIPIKWPNQSLKIFFQRLQIPAAVDDDETNQVPKTADQTVKTLESPPTNKAVTQHSDVDPAQIPSLNILLQNIRYGNKELGTVCVLTARQKNGMQIDLFSLDFPFFNMLAVGQWQDTAKGQQTVLRGRVKTTNLGFLLRNWQMTQSLKNTQGSLKFQLNWLAPPYRPDASTLNGKFSFNLKDGEVLNVIKGRPEMGIGWILNLLSIQTIEKLLTKPFSLLSPSTGFKFDTLKGDFVVTNGNAVTDDTVLKGYLADIEAKGRIGLAAKDYDLYVKVTPLLTGGVTKIITTVGGVVGKAIIGAINKLIGGILSIFFRTEFHVTGPWDKPKFEKI